MGSGFVKTGNCRSEVGCGVLRRVKHHCVVDFSTKAFKYDMELLERNGGVGSVG